MHLARIIDFAEGSCPDDGGGGIFADAGQFHEIIPAGKSAWKLSPSDHSTGT